MSDKNLDISFYSFLKKIDFKCQKCSFCCRSFPGAVYLTKEDFDKITNYLMFDSSRFLKECCRSIEKNGKFVVSLKEKKNFDCIFWSNSCLIYPVRPIQCLTYPFWPSIVQSEESWSYESKYCKGINKKGDLTFKQKLKFFIAEKNAIYMEYSPED